jgi:peptidoglycan hydrolase FlgJ
MNVQLSTYAATGALQNTAAASKPLVDAAPQDPKLRKVFDAFVGETLFAQALKSMRKTLDKPAYFQGGQAEEIFQQQLDQILAEKLSHSSSDKLSGPMFELFTLQRK